MLHRRPRSLSRALAILASLAVAGCASTEYEAARAATADGSVLQALKLDAADVKFQAPCVVAVKQQLRSRPLACVYVQTAKDLYFLRYDEFQSKYVPAVTTSIADLTTVALARFAAINSQIQVNRKGEVLAFHIVNAAFVNNALTQEIYSSLAAAGVAAAEPGEWVALTDPVPMPITIPIYIPR